MDVGISPIALAINPVTNKTYVANFPSGDVTVIDGANNPTATVDVGNNPISVAVNPATSKIYVANQADGTVTVIDGTSANAELSGLTVSEGTLTPAFDPATTAYTVDVGDAVTSIDVTATAADFAHDGLTIAGSPASSGIAESVPLTSAPTSSTSW